MSRNGGASGAPRPVCVAPLVAMVFDAYGNVQACCANALYPLGNVTRASLTDIWTGERAEVMRAALAEGDWSYGCGVCRFRAERSAVGMPLDAYDLYPLESTASTPEWPALLSFSLHNTCNLECIMCGGDSSSKIRTRRDGLPGLPHVYGEAFFEQLGAFVEHCTNVDFVGGEPFLVREHDRVWEMLIDSGRDIAVSVTTNGTTWNDKVERWLGSLDTTVFLSIDGVTRATFEQVRQGASFDQVMEHLERFRSYTQERGTQLILNWSLVRQNWHELAAMIEWAEERGLPVHVQTVIEPEFGVQRLPTEELRHVVRTMEAQSESLLPGLVINRDVWTGEVARLQLELESRARGDRFLMTMEPPSPGNVAHVVDVVRTGPSAGATGRPRFAALGSLGAKGRQRAAVETAREELHRWSFGGPVGRIRLDASLGITSADVGGVLPLGSAATSVVPADLAGLLSEWEQRLGGAMWVAEEFVEEDRVLHSLFFGPATRDKRGVVVRMISIPVRGGFEVLVASDLSLLRPPTGPSDVQVQVGVRTRRAGPALSTGAVPGTT